MPKKKDKKPSDQTKPFEPKPLFSVGFNFEEPAGPEGEPSERWGAFDSFIEGIRQTLTGMKIIQKRLRVLKSDLNYFFLTMSVKTFEVTFWIRTDDLYFEGYQPVKPKKQKWVSFGMYEEDVRIPESTPLRYGGGYDALRTAGAGSSRSDMLLGKQELEGAVILLSKNENDPKRPKALLVVIHSICEAIRFSPIADTVSLNLTSGKSLSPLDATLTTSWDKLAKALFDYHYGENVRFELDTNLATSLNLCTETPDEAEESLDKLLEIVQIVKYIDKMSSHGKGKSFVVATVASEDKGRSSSDNNHPNLSLSNKKDGSRKDFVDQGAGKFQKRSMYYSYPILVADPFILNVSLDSEMKELTWDPDTGNYDKFIKNSLPFSSMLVHLKYIVYKDAVEASVEVELERPISCWGSIMCSNDRVDDRCVIFSASHFESNKLEKFIPLSKSRIVVPLNSILQIDAKLRVSPPSTSIIGSFRFTPQINGTTVAKRVPGLRIKVNWLMASADT